MATTKKAAAYDIYVEACEAATKAAAKCVLQSVNWGSAKSVIGNEIDTSKPIFTVASGISGRASVTIRPARGALVTLLKERKVGYSGYYGGYEIPSWGFGAGGDLQSYEIARAKVTAAAAVLEIYGIKAYVNSSLD